MRCSQEFNFVCTIVDGAVHAVNGHLDGSCNHGAERELQNRIVLNEFKAPCRTIAEFQRDHPVCLGERVPLHVLELLNSVQP